VIGCEEPRISCAVVKFELCTSTGIDIPVLNQRELPNSWYEVLLPPHDLCIRRWAKAVNPTDAKSPHDLAVLFKVLKGQWVSEQHDRDPQIHEHEIKQRELNSPWAILKG
jgi:hypothetical protein